MNISNNTNSYDFQIVSLSWYHNGSEIMSGNRHTITNNATTLIVGNMEASDAGTYQVKINATQFSFDRSAPFCDSLLLPVLEPYAAFAPVTFTVQENHMPEYNPSSVISTCYVNEGSAGSLELASDIQFNSSLLRRDLRQYWIRNDTRISNDGTYNSTGSSQDRLSLRIMYNDSADITGDYVGTSWFVYFDLNSNISVECRGYYSLFENHFIIVTVKASYWRISTYSECTLLCYMQ